MISPLHLRNKNQLFRQMLSIAIATSLYFSVRSLSTFWNISIEIYFNSNTAGSLGFEAFGILIILCFYQYCHFSSPSITSRFMLSLVLFQGFFSLANLKKNSTQGFKREQSYIIFFLHTFICPFKNI